MGRMVCKSIASHALLHTWLKMPKRDRETALVKVDATGQYAARVLSLRNKLDSRQTNKPIFGPIIFSLSLSNFHANVRVIFFVFRSSRLPSSSYSGSL